jgi:DnaK suppressor protein
VSKTPAHKAPQKKTAAGKGKVAVSSAPKSAKTTPIVTKAAADKPASKKTVTPPVRKPAPAPARAKPVAAPVAAAKPAAPANPPVMKPAPSPAPVVAAVPAAPKKSSRNASKYGAPAVQAPLPPPTSRFADRFAPPRPPTRQMNNMELDTPRQAQKSDPKLANAWKSKAGRDLTEPEILAMPESEYMNDKQLEFFRVKLQTLKDDLLSNAGETTEHLREDTSIVPDPADRATIEEENALELRTRDRERKLLKKISQSLSRIESGDYGFCDETGEPIGLGRLIARPTATLSLEAQQRRELKQKMFGD